MAASFSGSVGTMCAAIVVSSQTAWTSPSLCLEDIMPTSLADAHPFYGLVFLPVMTGLPAQKKETSLTRRTGHGQGNRSRLSYVTRVPFRLRLTVSYH
eukprot:4580301-Amphidinium_carterae.1